MIDALHASSHPRISHHCRHAPQYVHFPRCILAQRASKFAARVMLNEGCCWRQSPTISCLSSATLPWLQFRVLPCNIAHVSPCSSLFIRALNFAPCSMHGRRLSPAPSVTLHCQSLDPTFAHPLLTHVVHVPSIRRLLQQGHPLIVET